MPQRYQVFRKVYQITQLTGTQGSVVLWLMLLLLLAACQSSAAATEPNPVDDVSTDYSGRKILWVDSYHQGYEWSDGIETGIRSVLEDTGAELKVIHLDTKRNAGDAFGNESAANAKTEIDAFSPDVLIACDDNAQTYLVVPYFKDTDLPVVFCGVNWDASIYGYPTQNVTGMIEVDLITQVVGHLKAYAQGDRIGYLSSDTPTGRKTAQIFNTRFFDGEMDVYFATSFAEFKEMYVSVQEEVDILYIFNNAGLEDWDQAEAEKFMAENAKVPVGATLDWMAPYVLITVAKRSDEQGEWAAETALKILDGAPVADIPPVKNKEGRLILNLDMAKKLDIVFSPSLLRNADIYEAEE